uniref:Uncharacterized protein n=1 Tax=Lygus hesperus TaxID=30085 RepID=A0A0A9YUK2_LYGHE
MTVSLVIGGTGTIGSEVALYLARQRHTVLLLSHSAEKSAKVIHSITQQTGNTDIHAIQADFTNLETLVGLEKHVSSLCNGAGVNILVNCAISCDTESSVTQDGLEVHWAINVVGPLYTIVACHPL